MPAYSCIFIYSSSLSSWASCLGTKINEIKEEEEEEDPCVYINKETGIIIAMWVDDLVIFGKDTTSINELKAALKKEYEMKDLGELKYFLGIQVHHDKGRKIIHITQAGYTRMIFE